MFLGVGQVLELGRREIAKSHIAKRASYDASSLKVFISHSSADSQLIPGVEAFFQQFGASIYADVMDDSLQGLPDAAKAVVLRAEIAKCDKLAVLVTAATKTSKWIPWELGLADGSCSPVHAALLPVTEGGREEDWAKQGYMELYPRVEQIRFTNSTSMEWAVRSPANGNYWQMKRWLGIKTKK